MEKNISLRGDSIFLAGLIGAIPGLKRFQGRVSDPDDVNVPEIIIVDLIDPQARLKMPEVCTGPNTLVIGVNAAESKVTLFSMTSLQIDSLTDLAQIVECLISGGAAQ